LFLQSIGSSSVSVNYIVLNSFWSFILNLRPWFKSSEDLFTFLTFLSKESIPLSVSFYPFSSHYWSGSTSIPKHLSNIPKLFSPGYTSIFTKLWKPTFWPKNTWRMRMTDVSLYSKPTTLTIVFISSVLSSL